MRQAKLERYIVVALFLFALVLFSVADKDSKKIEQLYTHTSVALAKLSGLIIHATGKN